MRVTGADDAVATDAGLAERLCYELQQRFLGTGHRVRVFWGQTCMMRTTPHLHRQTGPAGRTGLGEFIPHGTQALVSVPATDLGRIVGACMLLLAAFCC